MSDSPALGYSIVANLGDNRQITMQCFVGHDETPEVINTQIDKVMRVLDRQRAVGSIKELLVDAETQRTSLARCEDDLSRLEGQFHADMAVADAQLATGLDALRVITDAAGARGRSGPVGGEAGRAKAIMSSQKELSEYKARVQAERDQALQNMAVSISRYREEIAKVEAKITEAQNLIEGS